MKHKILGLLVGGLTLAATASPAAAATVTVQIESPTQVLAPTTVQTPASVTKDGTNTCPGATAIGALDAAVAGDWAGTYFEFGGSGDYTPESIRGESHAFGSGAFWSFYVNDQYQNVGACHIQVKDGDHVLVYAADDTFIPGMGGYDVPLRLTVGDSVVPGQPVAVKVEIATLTFDDNYAGTTTFDPAAGATVKAGDATATTAADGTATLTVPAGGPVSIVATLGDHAPDRTDRCATTGADGYCGTTVPGTTTSPQPMTVPAPPCKTTGDDGRCGTTDKRAAYGFITSIEEGQRFGKGQGPRELVGRGDEEPSGIADISIRLTRNDRGRCATLDAKAEGFVKLKRCGATRGHWVSVGTLAEWRYLLPAKLRRGRYVLDVRVKDKAGNTDDQLARGRNRVVFTVA